MFQSLRSAARIALGAGMVFATALAAHAGEFVVLTNKKLNFQSAATVVQRSDGNYYLAMYADVDDDRQYIHFSQLTDGSYQIQAAPTGAGMCAEVFFGNDGWHYTYMSACDPGNWAQKWDVGVVSGEWVKITNWSLESDLCLDSLDGQDGGEGFWLTMTPCGQAPGQTWIGTKTGLRAPW